MHNPEVFILAGGKSSRMGEDKGLVDFRGKKLVEHIIKTSYEITDTVSIITTNPAYKQFNLPLYADVYQEKGPMGGIFTALTNTRASEVLILSCDAPFISADFLKFLWNQKEPNRIIAPYFNERFEPLCAIYPTSISKVIEQSLLENRLKVQEFLKINGAKKLEIDEKLNKIYSNDFLSLNNKTDIRKYL
jgi:molybdenum cofactor guanylyltransferase